MNYKRYIKPNEPAAVQIGFSEAAMFTRIAGTVQVVILKPCSDGRTRGGYILSDTGSITGGYYLTSELGIYEDQYGFYVNEETPQGMKAEKYGDELVLMDYSTGQIITHL